jgi:hypothetical protein
MVASEKAQKEEAYVRSKAQLMVGTTMGWLSSRSGSILLLRWMHDSKSSRLCVKQMPEDGCRFAEDIIITDVIDHLDYSNYRSW